MLAAWHTRESAESGTGLGGGGVCQLCGGGSKHGQWGSVKVRKNHSNFLKDASAADLLHHLI